MVKFFADHLPDHILDFLGQGLRLSHFAESDDLSGGHFSPHIFPDGDLALIFLKHAFFDTFPGGVERHGLRQRWQPKLDRVMGWSLFFHSHLFVLELFNQHLF